MFTGIVEDVGKIRQLERSGEDLRLTVETALDLSDAKLGDSIAVDGACYTAVTLEPHAFTVELSAESVRRTIAGHYEVGTRVHVERALAVGGRLGGHLVLGHVDATGELRARRPEGDAVVLDYFAPGPVARYLVEKGSVTISGVSLTVGPVRPEGDGACFEVFIIPHTQDATTLTAQSHRPGARVNLEADIVGKYIERFVDARLGGAAGSNEALRGLLQRAGFASPQ